MKIYNYTLLIILLMVLFNIAGFGFTMNTTSATALGIFDLASYSSHSFWAILTVVFGAVGIAGALIGTIAGIPWTFILKGIYVMGALGMFIVDLIDILGQIGTGSWVFYVIGVILIPLIGGYAIALLEFWDGRD